MNIGIVPNLDNRIGGVYQYSLTLLEAFLTAQNPKNNFIIFTDILNHPIFPLLRKKKWLVILLHKTSAFRVMIKKVLIHLLPEGDYERVMEILYKIFLSKFSENKLKDKGNKVNNIQAMRERFLHYGVKLMIYPVSDKLSYEVGIPYIIVIHDFQHKYFPEFFSKEERENRDKIFSLASKKAEIIICESEYVKKDIHKFLKVPTRKIKILVSPPQKYIRNFKVDKLAGPRIKIKYNLPSKYFFYPAHFWRHKNHLNLIKAVKFVKSEFQEKINLVLVGSKKDFFTETVNEIKRLGLSNQIHFLGFVPDTDMPYIYMYAQGLVMPTFFESLSLPIWEAFAMGVPVISSNVCALPEQLGDAGLLFNPHDPKDMGKKIYKMWSDSKRRESYIKKGKLKIQNLSLEKYSQEWEKIVEIAATNL